METLPAAELRRLQSARLLRTFRTAYDRVPFLRARYEEAGVRPDGIRGVEDLQGLWFTRKSDFAAAYPLGLLAVSQRDASRIHASSGTTGKPTIVSYTRTDLEQLSELCARALAAGVVRPGDILQNAYRYGLFTGGLGLHAGADRLGMTVVPVSDDHPERQLTLLTDLGARVLACTPTLAWAIAGVIRQRGHPSETLGLRGALLGAEPWTNTMRAQIEEALGVDALNLYGLSEVMRPGVSFECREAKDGAHVQEDHFIAEIVDAETLVPVPAGRAASSC